jgi:hypothetical protein
MTTLCGNCGHALRVDDKYCSECGAPVVATAPPTQSQHWEYCEIAWGERGILIHDKSYFWVQDMVTGVEILRSVTTFVPSEVTRTTPYPTFTTATNAAVDELVQQLLGAGWESIATAGNGWWSQRFSRRVQ